MTRKEVIEGNKLIAEFMGYSVGFPHKTDKYGYIQTVEGYIIPSIVNPSPHPSDIDTHQFSLTDLRFHSSWDWLIPVINKIYDLSEYYTYKDETQTFYSEGGIEINTKYIEETYKDVVEFIEWFNSNKK